MFRGSMTALVTPFTADGVDERAFQDLVEWQIAEGTEAVVPCGTTGESPTLSHAEHMRVVELCVEAVGGRIPVIAGTGSNSTEEAIQLTRHAQDAGASAALVVVPYYNKPTQAGLYAHYEAIHNATDLPIIIYNIPGRSVVDMSVETMARLAELPNIVGVKDSTNDLGRPVLTRRAIGEDFVLLSGEDLTAAAFLAQGGHGCISVTANAAPAQCAKMHRAWREGDLAAFAEVRDSLVPLHRALFLESSPAPVKYALSVL
ncbi:MAG: 4-hydroxy-tetrahydrodipicolinate synthase, partial [Rhodospirillaceae bacterium]|nr:4-hydroxy-tetrahydrodipicolinate synthase [Rhodospirillaceae bacterium]